MYPTISTRWTWSERSYIHALLWKKLDRGVIRGEELDTILPRLEMVKKASKFLLNARAEYMLKGLNVRIVEAK